MKVAGESVQIPASCNMTLDVAVAMLGRNSTTPQSLGETPRLLISYRLCYKLLLHSLLLPGAWHQRKNREMTVLQNFRMCLLSFFKGCTDVSIRGENKPTQFCIREIQPLWCNQRAHMLKLTYQGDNRLR